MLPESRIDFEVAIICALPLEADAVLRLFDQHYDKYGDRYGKQKGDANASSTGRIGQHHVVLAHMHRMGIVSAAGVATRLGISFPKIRLALLVGTCAGVPLERPIILGDVIISDSIIEFDFGRQYPDHFARKSGLKDTYARPNAEIRGLLSKFQVPLILEGLEKRTLQNLARLQGQTDAARYPGVENDSICSTSELRCRQLSSHDFLCSVAPRNADIVPRGARESGCNALRCRNSTVDSTRRMRLASEVPTPMVHIGKIGSANTIVESEKHRDAIAGKDNIIAFDNEGAGVWDSLPCTIIKGVCDYADGNKTQAWQGYAAATAASAARVFLDHWTSHNQMTTEGLSRKRLISFNGETCSKHHIELAVDRSWESRSRG